MARFVASLLMTAVLGTGQSGVDNAKNPNTWPLPDEHTLIREYKTAALVLVGAFSNAHPGKGLGQEGTTDFTIELALKRHEVIKDKKTFTVAKYVPNLKNKVLLYCDVNNNDINPYCGIELEPGGDLVKYLTEAIVLKDKTAPERLRLCFNYLNNSEWMVAGDAYREFARTAYKNYKEMAKHLPPETIAGWLKDPKTLPDHVGLYALLLGHCGKVEHAELLRSILDDPGFKNAGAAKNLLTAYIMLEPKGGQAYVTDILKDGTKKFWLRYESLRALRFLQDERLDLVTRKDLVAGLGRVLDQGDIADFAMQDLRKMRQWDMTDQVLEQFGKKTHDTGIVRRAILQFALQSPEARAAAFVREQRQRDAAWVRDIEEMLKREK